MIRPVIASLGAAVVGAVALASCLPGDERPEPGSVTVTVRSTSATRAPFETFDGWTVTIDRFVAGVGDVRLHDANDAEGQTEPDTCNDYAETHYERLFDFVQVDGTEKVGLAYGLGSCNVEVRLQPPGNDPVIGPGATADDVDAMRLRGSDDYADDERTSLFVRGSATRDDRTLHFSWSFRRSFEIKGCTDVADVDVVSLVDLAGGVARTLDFEVRAEELFRRSPSDLSALQFSLFAQADELGDGDGNVTFEELAEVEAPQFELIFEDEIAPADNMADLVYEQLYLRVLRVVDGGACEIAVRDQGGPGR